MSLLQIYAGDIPTLSLNFADNNGNPLNVSGYEVRMVAKAMYSDPTGIINAVVTGIDANAVTGLVYFPMTTGETVQCAGDYLCNFYVGISGNRSTYPTDGLRILANLY